MFKFFKKYQKQTMAVVMVVLMVMFIIPTSFRNPQNSDDPVMGAIGSDKVLRSNLRDAEDQLSTLKYLVHRTRASGEEQWQPVLASLPRPFIEDLQTHPDKLYLLEYEAKQMGFSPDLANADQLLASTDVGVRTTEGSTIPYDSLPGADQKNSIRYSVANLLMVINAFQRAVDAVKVSDPLTKHELAANFQKIKVRVVDFPSKDYESRVSNPAADQLQKQFDAYADIEADSLPTEVNPFGFGYKYPNRVKLDYVSISHSELLKAVRASKDDYTWEVDANRYYLNHGAEFPTTAPVADQFSFVKPTSQPTTKPFSEVRQQIIDRLVDPQVDKLQREIQSELTDRLKQDYSAYHNKKTVSPAYDSFDYLKNIAQEIQSKYHVTLTIASIADSFKSAKELRLLPGIGLVSQFPDYATVDVDAFMPDAQKDDPDVLHLFQPSRPLSDQTGGDVYVFRITAADPAHKPANMKEVADQVERDWKRQQAFDLAKGDAQKLFDAAKTAGLPAAAGNRKIITTGAFSQSPGEAIVNYTLSTRAQSNFIHSTYALLGEIAKKDNTKPVALIEMPADAKVAVAELIAVESTLPTHQMAAMEARLELQLLQEYGLSIAGDWFNYDSIVQRVNYRPDSANRPARAAE
jgi:hypothetical protein